MHLRFVCLKMKREEKKVDSPNLLFVDLLFVLKSKRKKIVTVVTLRTEISSWNLIRRGTLFLWLSKVPKLLEFQLPIQAVWFVLFYSFLFLLLFI